MTDKILKTLVGYSVDQTSVTSAVRSAEAVRAGINNILTAAKSLDISGGSVGVASLNQEFDKLPPRIKTARDEIKALRTEIASLDSGGVASVGAGKAGGIGKFGSQLRSLPSIQLGGFSTDQVANVIRMAGALEQTAQVVPGVTAATTLLTPAIGATAAGLTALLIPVAAVAVAAAPLAIALKVVADRQEAAAKSAKTLADVYATQADAFVVGQEAIINKNKDTIKSATELFNSLNDSFRTNVERIGFLRDKQSKSDEKTAAEIQKTIDSTLDEQIKLSGSIDILRANLTQLGVTIDGTVPGLSKITEGFSNFLTNITGGIAKLGQDAQTKLTPFIEGLQKIAEEGKKRGDAEVKIVDKLNKDLVAIDQRAADDRLAIGKRLVDTLININEAAVSNAEKILADLEQEQAASAVKLSRDENNAAERANFDAIGRQITFQREEIAARKRHDLELKRLREDAAATEFEDSLDRNFAAIAANRRNLQRNLIRSNEDFNAEAAARLENFQNKNDDAARQFIFEHEQRLQAYQEQNTDAIAAAKVALKQNESDRRKARTAAQAAANQDYSDLIVKQNNERAAKTAGAIADLQLVLQTQAVMQQAYAASLAQAQALLSSVGGSTTSGGVGGTTTPTPDIRAGGGARGSFPTRTPFVAGASSRSSNMQSVNVSIPVTINGGDPNAIAAKMYKVARDVTADTLERINRR